MRARIAAIVTLACACGRFGFDAQPRDGAAGDVDGNAGARDAAATTDSGANVQPIAITAKGVWTVGTRLSRTLAQVVDRERFTFATWYQSPAENAELLCAGVSSQEQTFVFAGSTTGSPFFQQQNASTFYAAGPDYGSATTWPGSTAWVHLVVAVDLTQGADADRVRWWVDDEPQPLVSAPELPFAQDLPLYLGDNVLHTLGSKFDGNFSWHGALADTYLIWGHALDPSAFVVKTPDGLRAITYVGPFASESLHFTYAVPGHNDLAGGVDWANAGVVSSTSDLPY